MGDNPALFEDYAIRRIYDEKTETWYFSVVDIIRALLQQPDFQAARKYWNKLKERLVKEGSADQTSALAKLSTRQIAETMAATGMNENKVAGKNGAALPGRQGWSWRKRPAEV